MEIALLEAQPHIITWLHLQEETRKDRNLVKLVEQIQRGIPDSVYDKDTEIREFHKFQHGLMVMDGVVCYKNRVVVPKVLQQRVLEILHKVHQGVSGMVNRAEQVVFWPCITMDISKMRSACRTCLRNAPSQSAGPPVTPPSPSYPFEMIAADYYHLDGWNYLVLGDRYSGWISVYRTGRCEYDANRLVEAQGTFPLLGCSSRVCQ